MSWFTPEEDQVLIGFLKEMAEHGFPDMRRYLRECVNALLRAKKGDLTFSAGINWVDPWLGCHNTIRCCSSTIGHQTNETDKEAPCDEET